MSVAHIFYDFIQRLPFIIKNKLILGTSSALTSPISRHNKWSSNKLNTSEQIEKTSKRLKIDDELENKDDLEEEELDDVTDDDFDDAQSVKLSASLQIEENSSNQSYAIVKCPHWDKCMSNYFLTLKEETNDKHTNPGQLLHGI